MALRSYRNQSLDTRNYLIWRMTRTLRRAVSGLQGAVGIEAEYEHGYRFIRFYWQGAQDRTPKSDRFLGKTMADLQVKAVDELLAELSRIRAQRQQQEKRAA